MTFSSDASLQAVDLTGIRRTLRSVFPPLTDGSAAMGELLAAIERAYAPTEPCVVTALAAARAEAVGAELRA